jgi:hypothetical protein
MEDTGAFYKASLGVCTGFLNALDKLFVAPIVSKRTEVQRFCGHGFFSWIYSIWAPDFQAKGIFFSFLFSRSYSNIFMNLRCRQLQGFKISTVAYCAFCRSPL